MSFFSRIAKIWDQLVVKLRGKRLVALGARGVGKTHLRTFLQSGEIPESYVETAFPRKFTDRRLQLRDLDLKVKSAYDLPGSDEAYRDWQEECRKADVILYLFRVDLVLGGDRAACDRIMKDLGHIATWIDQRKAKDRPELFLLGTHCDGDPEFPGVEAPNYGAYTDRLTSQTDISEMILRVGGLHHARVMFGSMKDKPSTEAFVYEMFLQVLR